MGPDTFNRNFILGDDPTVNDPLWPGLFGSWICQEDLPSGEDGLYEGMICARVLPVEAYESNFDKRPVPGQ